MSLSIAMVQPPHGPWPGIGRTKIHPFVFLAVPSQTPHSDSSRSLCSPVVCSPQTDAVRRVPSTYARDFAAVDPAAFELQYRETSQARHLRRSQENRHVPFAWLDTDEEEAEQQQQKKADDAEAAPFQQGKGDAAAAGLKQQAIQHWAQQAMQPHSGWHPHLKKRNKKKKRKN